MVDVDRGRRGARCWERAETRTGGEAGGHAGPPPAPGPCRSPHLSAASVPHPSSARGTQEAAHRKERASPPSSPPAGGSPRVSGPRFQVPGLRSGGTPRTSRPLPRSAYLAAAAAALAAAGAAEAAPGASERPWRVGRAAGRPRAVRSGHGAAGTDSARALPPRRPRASGGAGRAGLRQRPAPSNPTARPPQAPGSRRALEGRSCAGRRGVPAPANQSRAAGHPGGGDGGATCPPGVPARGGLGRDCELF